MYFVKELLKKFMIVIILIFSGACQCLWYNRNIRSKSKQFFYYEEWHDKGILYISDLLDPPHPGAKLFEELILDFEVSRKDRRKYNFLMQNIP